MNPPTSDFMGVNFPSLEYSVDMLSEFQPQHPSDFFVPASTTPLDFVSDLFRLPSATMSVQLQHSTGLPDSANAQNPLSSSSSGSPGKERKGSRDRQSSGRWSTRDKGPVSETRKLEVNREAQRRFRQRQKVGNCMQNKVVSSSSWSLMHNVPSCTFPCAFKPGSLLIFNKFPS